MGRRWGGLRTSASGQDGSRGTRQQSGHVDAQSAAILTFKEILLTFPDRKV